MPYKDPERQRAAVRRYQVAQRLGPNPSRKESLEAEVRSLKARLQKRCQTERTIRAALVKEFKAKQPTNGTDLSPVISRLAGITEDLVNGQRATFPAEVLGEAATDVRKLMEDVKLGTF